MALNFSFIFFLLIVFGEILTPVDYVNPKMGTISQILVPAYPTVNLPNGMLRFYPRREDSGQEYMQTLPITLSSHRGDLMFTVQASATGINSGLYDLETIKPYEYHVYMLDDLVDISLAVSYSSGIFKFQFEGSGQRRIYIPSTRKENFLETQQDVRGDGGWARVYLHLEFSPSPASLSSSGEAVFTSDVTVVYIRFGVSYISLDQAKKNVVREIPKFSYNDTVANGRKAWNDVLERIDVIGSSSFTKTNGDAKADPFPAMIMKDATDEAYDQYDNRVKFYTSIYRVYERMIKISEDGQYFSGYNRRVNPDGGSAMYVDDWIWDTFRAAHPLRALIDPTVEGAMVLSYIRMAQQTSEGWLPTFPEVSGDSHRMNGNHAIASIIDAYNKGITTMFPLQDGFSASVKTITGKTHLPWVRGGYTEYDNFYAEHGYFPGLRPGQGENIRQVHPWEYRQCVAVTLAAAFDQWCVAQQALVLRNDAEYRRFLIRSYDFQNIYNFETGFFHPKDNAGKFITPFDYKFSGGRGARDYYDENNGWTYRWDVQHNIGRLVTLMGGPDAFVENLDQTFREPLGRSRGDFFAHLPDQTANVGQFTMANEPSMHIPFLYNYGLQPWKTQKRVPLLLRQWWRNDLYGIPGDEDGGGLSAFVVFAAIGLYPVTPGLPVYTLSAPIFPRVVIRVGVEREFTLVAEGLSARNKYIQSATRNGAEWKNCYISHQEILKGGTLVLTMGPKANRRWGAQTAPPSSEPYPK